MLLEMKCHFPEKAYPSERKSSIGPRFRFVSMAVLTALISNAGKKGMEPRKGASAQRLIAEALRDSAKPCWDEV
jgi:hypothetical protein